MQTFFQHMCSQRLRQEQPESGASVEKPKTQLFNRALRDKRFKRLRLPKLNTLSLGSCLRFMGRAFL
jgi:hypothetical protein